MSSSVEELSGDEGREASPELQPVGNKRRRKTPARFLECSKEDNLFEASMKDSKLKLV